MCAPNALKAGTTSGAVARMFITGVSPLMLDDLSSGFNIATHGSLDPGLTTLAGFTRADTERAVDELLAASPELATTPGLSDRSGLLRVLEVAVEGRGRHRRHGRRQVDQPPRVHGEPAHDLEGGGRVLLGDLDLAGVRRLQPAPRCSKWPAPQTQPLPSPAR